MRDLVLLHLYIQTANFFSEAYKVLSGKKHDFASREERSNEKQTSPGQMLPWDSAWVRTQLETSWSLCRKRSQPNLGSDNNHGNCSLRVACHRVVQRPYSGFSQLPVTGTASLMDGTPATTSKETSQLTEILGGCVVPLSMWHDEKGLGSRPCSPENSLAVCPGVTHRFRTSGFHLSNGNINLIFLTLQDVVIIKRKCAASIMQ